jgi:hypothetical protein
MQIRIPYFSTIIRAKISRVNKSTIIRFQYKLTRIAAVWLIGITRIARLFNRTVPGLSPRFVARRAVVLHSGLTLDEVDFHARCADHQHA